MRKHVQAVLIAVSRQVPVSPPVRQPTSRKRYSTVAIKKSSIPSFRSQTSARSTLPNNIASDPIGRAYGDTQGAACLTPPASKPVCNPDLPNDQDDGATSGIDDYEDVQDTADHAPSQSRPTYSSNPPNDHKNGAAFDVNDEGVPPPSKRRRLDAPPRGSTTIFERASKELIQAVCYPVARELREIVLETERINTLRPEELTEIERQWKQSSIRYKHLATLDVDSVLSVRVAEALILLNFPEEQGVVHGRQYGNATTLDVLIGGDEEP